MASPHPEAVPRNPFWRRCLQWLHIHMFSAREKAISKQKRAGKKLQKKRRPVVYGDSGLTLANVGGIELEQPRAMPLATDLVQALEASRPPLARNASKQSSIFGLTPVLDDFRYEVELSFLTPLAQEVQHHLRQVTGIGTYISGRVPGTEILVMQDMDSARALAAVRYLTRDFPTDQRILLCRELKSLLTPDQLTVLKRALYTIAPIHCEDIEERIATTRSAITAPFKAVVRPSPARRVAISEPARPKSSSVLIDNHRFSRGAEQNAERTGGRREQGDIRVRTDICVQDRARLFVPGRSTVVKTDSRHSTRSRQRP
ncbi:hypothetical protein LTR86_008488 [Recurvomyces mirabilis]|nr:hypothetical protein LTR86_008488 [Recurvomyces mirabilis]